MCVIPNAPEALQAFPVGSCTALKLGLDCECDQGYLPQSVFLIRKLKQYLFCEDP